MRSLYSSPLVDDKHMTSINLKHKEDGARASEVRERTEDMSKDGEVICVTGGSGGIGSWVVHLLLNRGYTVHATVQNLENEKETKHLEALEGADKRLRLFQIDLLNYDSISAAVDGCVGVIHLASPAIVDKVADPQSVLLDPALKGTLNVLTAAKEKGVKRVVLTSSNCAMMPNANWPDDDNTGEGVWADLEYCRKNELWYSVSKTLAEKAAWEFSKEKGLDLRVVNPCCALGYSFPPTLNVSMAMLLGLFKGSTEIYHDVFMGPVHFKDIAMAHILLYEKPSASGRHLCVEHLCDWADFAEKVAELYPEYKIPRMPKKPQPELLKAKNGGKKLKDLGLEFTPMEEIIKDAVECLKSRGYLS